MYIKSSIKKIALVTRRPKKKIIGPKNSPQDNNFFLIFCTKFHIIFDKNSFIHKRIRVFAV